MRVFLRLLLHLSLIAVIVSLTAPATAWLRHSELGSTSPPPSVEQSELGITPRASNNLPGDEYWDDRFNLEGVSGPVYAVANWGGLVCIGGDFDQVGSLAVQNFACWDTHSSTWRTFGNGLSGPVHAVVVLSSGIYVGGQFSQAGSASAQNIAHWSYFTEQWEALGGGVSGPVYALAIADSYIYAGGLFAQAGSSATNNVARWDTNTLSWSALAIGQSNGVNGPVHALAVTAGPIGSHDVYVGGSFTGIGGVSSVNAHNIAKWNSNTGAWAEVSGSVSGPVYALRFCGSNLYVGGHFSQAGTGAAFNIASWSTSTAAWSPLGLGTSNTVEAIACTGKQVYVGGRFSQAGSVAAHHVARWNTASQSWSALGRGTSGDVFGVATVDVVYSKDVFVGGLFASAGATASRNFGRYTGDYDNSNPEDVNWDKEFCMAGPNDRVSAIVASGDGLYYGGGFTQAAGSTANHIARYDTTAKTWSAIGAGVNGNVEVIAVSGSDVYVGGDFTQAGSVAAANIARWNSATGEWSALGSGTSGPVYALTISGNAVYVGGNFAIAGGVTVNHVARWDTDARSWSALGGGSWIGMNAPVRALAVSGGDVYAGGSFTYAQDVLALHIARWNGSAWSALGSGLNNHVYDVAVQGGDVYAAGAFSTAGGSPAHSVARWDGALWHAMPGMAHPAYEIAFNLWDLFVAGEFNVPGGSAVNGVGRWDGAQWQPLGSGTGNSYALAVGADGLYIGGSFSSLANGLRCSPTALWKMRTTTPGTGSISGRVRSPTGEALPGARVQVCRRSEAECTWLGMTDANGDYQAARLSDGEYLVRAYPPQGVTALPASPGTLVITGGDALQADISLPGISPLPAGAALSPSRTTDAGVPLINWRQATRLTVRGCAGGSATYQALQDGVVVASGALIESSADQYTAHVPSLHPTSGYVHVRVDITCPSLRLTQSNTFDIYVDPSGTVKHVSGVPFAGAQVTLYAYDPVTMSLTQVPEEDPRLSPANWANPDVTDAAGHFGWDVSAGAYVILAAHDGCVAPENPDLDYVQTDLVHVPFDMVDLELQLACAGDSAIVFTPLVMR